MVTPDEVIRTRTAIRRPSGVLWDHLDFLRGVEAFLNCVPAASLEAMNVGMRSLGLDACHKFGIMDGLLDSNGLFLTGNTSTMYALAAS